MTPEQIAAARERCEWLEALARNCPRYEQANVWLEAPDAESTAMGEGDQSATVDPTK